MGGKTIELEKFLNQQYLCESLTVKEIQILIDFTELVTFNKGETIADVGEVGEALYFVIGGAVGLIPEGKDYSAEVARIDAGEIMGEMSFFDRHPRSVSLVALKDETQMLRLSRAMYKRLRVEHPYIAVNLLEHTIVSLDHLFRRVSKDVTTLADYLYAPGRK
jgi:signal-transduction protein with cAMP-binding, CBS, and nucleotidyltransferase domain